MSILLSESWTSSGGSSFLPLTICQFHSRIDESFLSRWEYKTYSSDEFEEMQQSLFEHLCPLLILKMLPMKTFNDLNSSIMYGHLSHDIERGKYSCLVYLFLLAHYFLITAEITFEFIVLKLLSF